MNLEKANEIMKKHDACLRQTIDNVTCIRSSACKDCDLFTRAEELEQAEKILKNEYDINNKPDNVNNPKHYAGSCSIECIDAMQMAYGSQVVHNFCICNAFKYLWRHKNKNGAEDLNKAEWYINKAEELTKIHTPIINDLRTILEKYREKFESSNE